MEEKAKLPKATEENLRVYNEMQKLASEESDKKRQIELGFKAVRYADQFCWSDEVFEENGKRGVKDVLGKILVPAMYDDFPEIYCSVFRGENEDAYPAINDGRYGLVRADGTGRPLCEFCYDKILHEMAPSIWFFVYKDGKMGYMDENGELLIPCEMDNIYYNGLGLELCEREGKLGLLTGYGLYVAPDYDEYKTDGSMTNPLMLRRGEEWGYVDANDGHFIPMDEYDEDSMFIVDDRYIFVGPDWREKNPSLK